MNSNKNYGNMNGCSGSMGNNDPFEKDLLEIVCLNCSNTGHSYCTKFTAPERDEIYNEFLSEVVKIKYNGVYANMGIF